jgi:hypothetical protein
MKPYIRVCGDVHNRITGKGGRCYKNLIAEAQYSLQLGDMGFDYSALSNIDSAHHKILPGNHDHYERFDEHFLGDFGVHTFPLLDGEYKFFYIRGGYSIDRNYRTFGVDWFPQEELNYQQATQALTAYIQERPKIVMSHECPEEIIPLVVRNNFNILPSSTARLLQACYESHRPDYWFFGHHHHNIRIDYNGRGVTPFGKEVHNELRKPTTFICLGELGYMDIDEQGCLSTPSPQ